MQERVGARSHVLGYMFFDRIDVLILCFVVASRCDQMMEATRVQSGECSAYRLESHLRR